MCHLDKKGNPIKKKKNCGGGEGHIMQLLRSQIPYQNPTLGPWKWNHGVLAIGPPENSPQIPYYEQAVPSVFEICEMASTLSSQCLVQTDSAWTTHWFAGDPLMPLYQTINSLSNLKGWQLQIYFPYDLYPLLIFPLYFALKRLW